MLIIVVVVCVAIIITIVVVVVCCHIRIPGWADAAAASTIPSIPSIPMKMLKVMMMDKIIVKSSFLGLCYDVNDPGGAATSTTISTLSRLLHTTKMLTHVQDFLMTGQYIGL